MSRDSDENIIEVPNDVITKKEEHTKKAISPIYKKHVDVGEKNTAQNGGQKAYQEPSHKKDILSPQEWFREIGWSNNPFVFSINPSLLVGYKEQLNKIDNAIKSRHKAVLILGPTGSGKTTLLKWLNKNIVNGTDSIYISKIPDAPEEFVYIFNEKYKSPWFLRWLIPNIKNIYQIPDFLNKKLKKKHLVILCDEVHEADHEVLEWLRVLCDQIDNVSIVLSGLPVFEEKLRDELETLRKRISVRVELVSLTKEETRELIEKRIHDVGGVEIEPFLPETIDVIYERTGGFPREIIRICDTLVTNAIESGKRIITPDLVSYKEPAKKENVSLKIMEDITDLQKRIIESISARSLSPGQIADKIGMRNYKSRQHAVRSVNNILKRMMDENMVERKRSGRAFVYVLSPKLKTMFVKS